MPREWRKVTFRRVDEVPSQGTIKIVSGKEEGVVIFSQASSIRLSFRGFLKGAWLVLICNGSGVILAKI